MSMLTYNYHNDKSKSMKSKPKQVITIVSNATVAKLDNAPKDVQLFVAKELSYTMSGFDRSTLGKKQGWDGKKSFFSFKTQTFPAGFARAVVAKLTKEGHRVNWVTRPLPEPRGPARPIVDTFGYSDERYHYQLETADKLVRFGRMVANVATGGGKSRIARICYKRIARNTLFLTTRGVLMYQMRDNFEELLGEKVGVVGDGHWTPTSGFNVGMVQTLAGNLEVKTLDNEVERAVELEEDALARKIEAYKRKLTRAKKSPIEVMTLVKAHREELLKARISDEELVERIKKSIEKHNKRREETLKFLRSVEFLILEEAHEAGSNEYYNVCMACKNAYYRLALTGTAFKRADEESNMRLMAVSGPVGITVSEKKLIDLGVLATPYFEYIKLPKADKLFKSTSWARAYELGVTGSEYRNRKIIEKCEMMKQYGLTSMVLVLRKEHGKSLKLMMKKRGLRVSFIDGDASQAERKAALQKLAVNDIDVLIGTTILDVGVDVPSVGAIILGGGGKAEIALRQRIGRGLRAKKPPMPNVCFVFDFHDRYNDHLTKHGAARRRIVMETPGFVENIVETINPAEYGFIEVNKTC